MDKRARVVKEFCNIAIPIVFVFCTEVSGAQKNTAAVKSEELYQAAINAVRSKDTARSLTLLNSSIAINNNHVDAKVLLAKICFNTRRYEQAIRISVDVIQHFPKYRDVYYYVIGGYINTGDNVRALSYTDAALNQFGSDKEFMLKKLGLLDALGRFTDGDALANYLYKIYWLDEKVQAACSYHYFVKAGWILKSKNDVVSAKGSFDMALKINPENKDARIGEEKLLYNNKELMLDQLNAELEKDSTSYELLMHKLGVLQEMRRYAESLEVLSKILKYHPNDRKALLLNTSLTTEAAEFYQKTNYYALYQTILEKDPANQEALNKVIGIAIDRGDNKAALQYVDLALKRLPGNYDFLSKKLDLEVGARNYVEAAKVAPILYAKRPTAKLKAYTIETILSCGRFYLAQQQPDSAIYQFNLVLGYDSLNVEAYKGKISGWYMLNDREQVMNEINKVLSIYPDNKALIIKKSSLLAEFGSNEKASAISDSLLNVTPGDKRLESMYIDQRLAAAAEYMSNEDYKQAQVYLDGVLAKDPHNNLALNYKINLLDAEHKYAEAMAYVDTALAVYPGDKSLLVKKASVLFNFGLFPESVLVYADLHNRYPYSKKIADALEDAMISAGKTFEKKHMVDSAIFYYNEIAILNSKDTLADLYKVNILIELKKYFEALNAVNSALNRNASTESLLQRRVVILEGLKRFKEAVLFADTLSKLFPYKSYQDYASYLKEKTYKTQFALNFLHSGYDDPNTLPYTYTSFTIRHLFDRGSYAGTIRLAGRQQGNGIEGDAEFSFKHSASLVSNGDIAVGNGTILPKFRLAYSVFKTISKTVEVEFGGRYLSLDSLTSVTLVTSFAKRFGSVWFNLKAFGIQETDNLAHTINKNHLYTAYNLTGRYYTHNDLDYISLIAGVGTSPDDLSRLVLFPKLAGLLSKSVGFGYQKAIDYNSSIGITGAWTNTKTGNSTKTEAATFLNQYDLYLDWKIKF